MTLVRDNGRSTSQTSTYGTVHGANGSRLSGWALVEVGEHDRLQIRRAVTRKTKGVHELAYFFCHTPHPVPLDVLVRLARSWRAVEGASKRARTGGLSEGCPRRLR